MQAKRRPSWVVGLAGLAVVGANVSSMADEPKADRVDPAVRRFLQSIRTRMPDAEAFGYRPPRFTGVDQASVMERPLEPGKAQK